MVAQKDWLDLQPRDTIKQKEQTIQIVFHPQLKQIGQVARTQGNHSLDIVYFWEDHSFPEKLKSKQPCHDHQLKQNIGLWGQPHVNSYGFSTCCRISKSSLLHLSSFIVTTRLHYTSRLIRFSMKEPNTSKQTVIQ